MCAVQQKQYGTAEVYFAKVLRLKPNFVDGYVNLSHLMQLCKRYEKAIARLEKAYVLSPNEKIIYQNIGVVYGQQSKFNEAVGWLRDAVSKGSTEAEQLLKYKGFSAK